MVALPATALAGTCQVTRNTPLASARPGPYPSWYCLAGMFSLVWSPYSVLKYTWSLGAVCKVRPCSPPGATQGESTSALMGTAGGGRVAGAQFWLGGGGGTTPGREETIPGAVPRAAAAGAGGVVSDVVVTAAEGAGAVAPVLAMSPGATGPTTAGLAEFAELAEWPGWVPPAHPPTLTTTAPHSTR